MKSINLKDSMFGTNKCIDMIKDYLVNLGFSHRYVRRDDAYHYFEKDTISIMIEVNYTKMFQSLDFVKFKNETKMFVERHKLITLLNGKELKYNGEISSNFIEIEGTYYNINTIESYKPIIEEIDLYDEIRNLIGVR